MAQLLERVLNEVLEAEIADHLGADPHERTDGRRGWRNGHYEQSLTARVGTLDLQVPRDREVHGAPSDAHNVGLVGDATRSVCRRDRGSPTFALFPCFHDRREPSQPRHMIWGAA